MDSSNSLKKGLGFRRDPRKNVREGGSQKVVPMQDASMSQLLLWAAGLRATGDPKSCPIKGRGCGSIQPLITFLHGLRLLLKCSVAGFSGRFY